MSLGILAGQPRHYLTNEILGSAEKLANWIEREIPSFAGPVPVEYYQAIMAVLAKYTITAPVLRGAFEILEKRGIQFTKPPLKDIYIPGVILPPQPPPLNPGNMPQPRGKEISLREKVEMIKYTIDEYERRYVLAIKTADPVGAAQILEAILRIVLDMALGHGEAGQMRQNDPMREWNEFNKAVDEALERAPTLQTHVRFMTREEYQTIRTAGASPNFQPVTFRITTRTVPSTRRARR